jgi:hypothetical protein
MKARAIAAFALALLAVGTAQAFAGVRSGYNSFNFGNSQAGGKGTYSIVTRNNNGYSSAQLTATGNVMFLNKTIKGIEFSATTQNSAGKKSSTYSLSTVGDGGDRGTKTVTYTWNKPVNRSLIQASPTIVVGPIPVRIGGSLGGGASIGYTLELSRNGVGVSGNASAWTNGSASAGIGVSLLNLSLRSALQLAKTSFQPSTKVSPASFSGVD